MQSGNAVRFAIWLPGIHFWAVTGLTPHSASQHFSCSGPDARDDLSLARNDLRFHGCHSGVNVPGLPLRFPASRVHCPFGLSAPPPKPVRPGFRPLHRFKPVAASPTSLAIRFSSLHSPPGVLPPSGSKRSTGPADYQSAFRTRPMLSHSPQPFSITSVSATDHRS